MWKNNLKREHVLEWVYTEMEGRGVHKLNPIKDLVTFSTLGAS